MTAGWWWTSSVDEFRKWLPTLSDREIDTLMGELRAGVVQAQADLNQRRKSDDPEAWGKKSAIVSSLTQKRRIAAVEQKERERKRGEAKRAGPSGIQKAARDGLLHEAEERLAKDDVHGALTAALAALRADWDEPA